MRILLTSASKPAALALSRVLAAEGHTVYAAEEERVWRTAPARYSRAYSRFYRLSPGSLSTKFWDAIAKDIHIVIPFDTLSKLVKEHLEAKGVKVLGMDLFQDDQHFRDFVRDRVINTAGRGPSVVKVPVTFEVHSQMCIAEILSHYTTTTFSLQAVACCDSDGEDTLVDIDCSASVTSSRTRTKEESLVLSCQTLDDNMVDAVKCLHISKSRPFQMTEMVEEGTIYSASTLVTSNGIHTFVVTTTSGSESDFTIVPSSQSLFEVLYLFTKRVTEALQESHTEVTPSSPCVREAQGFATHLTLNFCVKDDVGPNGDFIRKITAISCRTEPHMSLILFCATSSLRRQLALAYARASSTDEPASTLTLQSGVTPWGVYSIPSVAIDMLHVVYTFAPWEKDWWMSLAQTTMLCWGWAFFFQEETWSFKDPGPALCLWTIMLLKRVAQAQCLSTIRGSFLWLKKKSLIQFIEALLVCWTSAQPVVLLVPFQESENSAESAHEQLYPGSTILRLELSNRSMRQMQMPAYVIGGLNHGVIMDMGRSTITMPTCTTYSTSISCVQLRDDMHINPASSLDSLHEHSHKSLSTLDCSF